jgi:hypothetical protein
MSSRVFVVFFVLECSLILLALPCLWFSRPVTITATTRHAEESRTLFWCTQVFHSCECRIKPTVFEALCPTVFTSHSFTTSPSIIYFILYISLCFYVPLFLAVSVSFSVTVARLINKFPPFMEHEGSISCSQEPATGPHPEPDESSPQPHILLL